MCYRMTPTCADILARAYYGLDLIGSAILHKKAARKTSIKRNLKLQWITEDHRITEQGLWELRRALSSPANGIRIQKKAGVIRLFLYISRI